MREYDVKYGLYKPTSIIFDRWFGDLQYLSYVWMPEVHTHMHVSPQNAMVFDPTFCVETCKLFYFTQILYANIVIFLSGNARNFSFWKPKTRNFNVPAVFHSARSLLAVLKWLKVATDRWSVKWPPPTFGSRDQQDCLTPHLVPHKLILVVNVECVNTAVAIGDQFNRNTLLNTILDNN